MNTWRTALAIFPALSASIALADDFKTIDGKEYKNATVTRVEPDGVVVKMKSGISKLYFVELPKEVQQRFNYDPQQARMYSAEQAGNYAAYQKQEEEAQHRREEMAAQRKPVVIEQQPEQQPNTSPQSQGRTRAGPHPAKTLTRIPVHGHETRPPPSSKPSTKPAKRPHQ